MLIILRTVIIGCIGAWVAHFLGLPSSWLVGALIAVVVSGVMGIKVAMPKSTTTMISLFLGISVAQNISSDLVNELSHWGRSAALLCLMMAALLLVMYRYYKRLPGWQREEAMFCSVPGNLAIIMSMAPETGANVRRIALVHSVRLLFLVFLVPMFLPLAERELTLEGLYLEHPEQMVATFVLAIALGWLFKRCKVPAAMLVGGLVSTIVLRELLGWDWKLPSVFLLALLVFLGCATGSRFDGIKLADVLPELKAAAGGLVITLVISAVFAVILHYWTGVSWTQALLAYAPGGMEVMIAIAMNQNVDPLFVATHQMFRMLTMSLMIPILLFHLKKRQTA
jgi:membrane AbrB-like protein